MLERRGRPWTSVIRRRGPVRAGVETDVGATLRGDVRADVTKSDPAAFRPPRAAERRREGAPLAAREALRVLASLHLDGCVAARVCSSSGIDLA